MTTINGAKGNLLDVNTDGSLNAVSQISTVREFNLLLHSGTSTNSNGNAVNTSGYNTALFRVDGVGFRGIINFEGTFAEGAAWMPISAVNVSTNISNTSTQTNGLYRANVSGFHQVRARISSQKSGVMTIAVRLGAMSNSDGTNVQIAKSKDLPIYDRHAKRAFPKQAYIKPSMKSIPFRVRGFDPGTNTVYGIKPGLPLQNTLLSSNDEFKTITEGFAFEANIQKVVVSDTHILVAIWGETNTTPGKVYRTNKENGVAGPFEEVQGLELNGNNMRVDRLGFNSYYDFLDSSGKAIRNYVCITQYGEKTAGNNANRAFFSKDGGKTFKKVFTGPAVDEAHTHLMVYDKYMDRLWISHGDSGVATIYFSDDHGETWEIATTGFWPTVIVPMPHYVLFGSDSPPMGLHRWNRSEEEQARAERRDIKTAFEPAFFPVRGNVAGDVNFAVQPAIIDDWTAYIPFIGMGGNNKTFLVATADGGETAHIVWHDRVATPLQGFALGVFGPLQDNTLVCHYEDNRAPTNDRVMSIPLLEWETV